MLTCTRKQIALGVKTLTITEEAYELLAREKRGKESFSEVIKRLVQERGELKNSFGAWTMNDEEEEKIFSNLKKHWRKATGTVRSRKAVSQVLGH